MTHNTLDPMLHKEDDIGDSRLYTEDTTCEIKADRMQPTRKCFTVNSRIA